MKRIGNLYPKVYDFENLLLAFQKARKGKRKNKNVAAFEVNMENELLKLQEELSSKTYQPGSYHTFFITDPKKRMISAAPFRDRVIHHALCNIIEPIFEPTLIHETYANRKGKGTHKAIFKCQKYLRKYDYVLKADIRKYFPSIDHEILKKVIRKKIKCVDTLLLVDKIIDNSNPQEPVLEYFENDDLFTPYERRKGIPMGNLTSQFFANLYLSGFDHFVKEELKAGGYIRYVDDFVVFSNCKNQLFNFRESIEKYLGWKLRLSVHSHKTQIFPTKVGVSFLGQRIFKTHRRVRRQNLLNFYKRTQKRVTHYLNGSLPSEKFEQQINSWVGHIGQVDAFGLQRTINKQLKSRKVPLFISQKGSWLVLG